jgi:hypothetical protein
MLNVDPTLQTIRETRSHVFTLEKVYNSLLIHVFLPLGKERMGLSNILPYINVCVLYCLDVPCFSGFQEEETRMLEVCKKRRTRNSKKRRAKKGRAHNKIHMKVDFFHLVLLHGHEEDRIT